MANEPADPAVLVRATLETLLFAPIGLGASLVEDAPEAVRRVRQELSNARFIGRLAVEQGAARLRQRPVESVEPSVAGSSIIDVEVVNDAPAGSLPIEGYDEMPAIEIVARLVALSPDQLAAVAGHESDNRRRRTVLGKIAQLAEA